MADVQVAASHYGDSYHSPERYYSYVEQLTLIKDASPGYVIEIGVGGGFIMRELRMSGISALGLDVDPTLGPDCVGSVDCLPLRSGACDLISCCEVLEHLPFERFASCLAELARVTKHDALVSLPDT